MAHTKAGGSTRNGRDSAANRLGVKLFGGQAVKSGGIIVRQRGTRMIAGNGTAVGKDQTIYATATGTVAFTTTKKKSFTGQATTHTVVHVTAGA